MRPVRKTMVTLAWVVALGTLALASSRGRADPSPASPVVIGTVERGGTPRKAVVELRRVAPGGEESDDGQLPYAYWLAPLVESSAPVRTAAAGSDGRFALAGVEPGTYELAARSTEGGEARQRIRVEPRRSPLPTRLFLADGAERVAGRMAVPDRPAGPGWLRWTRTTAGPLADDAPGPEVVVPVDDAGRFEAGGLESAEYRLAFTRPGLHLGGFRVTVPTSTPLHIDAGAGLSSFSGRVFDARTARPIQGAIVVVLSRWPESRRYAVTSAQTDATGGFSLPAGPQPTGMDITAPGYAGVRRSVGGTRRQDARLEALGSVRGMVRRDADGTPVPGAVVHVLAAVPGPWTQARSARTAADGQFHVAGVEPGSVHCFVLGGGVCSTDLVDRFSAHSTQREAPRGALHVPAGGAASVTLRVEPACVLAGRVVDEVGLPVEGAEVDPAANHWMFERSELQRAFRASTGATSSADGSFALDVPARDTYVLTATRPDRTLVRSQEIATVPEGVRDLVVTFPPERWLQVRVRCQEDQTPVRDAEVTVKLHWMSGRDGLALPTTWFTDARGLVRVGPLPAGMLALHVQANGYLQPTWLDVEPERGLEPAPALFDAELSRGLVLSGLVVRPPGMPADAVRFEMRSPHQWALEPSQAWPLDAGGRFRIWPAWPGSYALRAVATWRGTSWLAQADTPAGTSDVSLVLAETTSTPGTDAVPKGDPGAEPIRPPPPSWTLHVSDATGTPVHNAKVIVRERDATGEERGVAQDYVVHGTARVEAGAHDSVVFVEVSNPTDAQGNALALAAAEVGPLPGEGGPVPITLARGHELRGIVTDEDGKPVRGVAVLALPHPAARGTWFAGHHHARGTTGEDGTFRMEGLADRDYTLGLAASRAYVVRETTAARPGSAPVTLFVRRLVTVRITCRDSENKPVAGASIYLERSSQGMDWPLATTDARGTAFLRGLDPQRRYSLEVSPRNTALRELVVPDWLPKDVELVLECE